MQSRKMENDRLSVLMVGCGNIAGGFDEGRSAGNLPLTHAGAYARDGRFSIVACVEPDAQRRACFMGAWSVADGFATIDELLGCDLEFDVVSICSTTQCHAHDAEIALRLKPKLIFCEKPVTKSVDETKNLVEMCRDAQVPLAVNHTRRWDPDVVQLRADLLSGKWGRLRSVTALYGKGILNNGSHLIDLLNFLIGPLEILQVGRPIFDHFPDDPSVPAYLEGAQGQIPVQLSCAHATDYSAFEVQFVFSQGVLTMEDGGMLWRERRVTESKVFKGYNVLEAGSQRIGEYPRATLGAVNNIFQAIRHGQALASTGVSALEAQRICEQIKQQALLR